MFRGVDTGGLGHVTPPPHLLWGGGGGLVRDVGHVYEIPLPRVWEIDFCSGRARHHGLRPVVKRLSLKKNILLMPLANVMQGWQHVGHVYEIPLPRVWEIDFCSGRARHHGLRPVVKRLSLKKNILLMPLANVMQGWQRSTDVPALLSDEKQRNYDVIIVYSFPNCCK